MERIDLVLRIAFKTRKVCVTYSLGKGFSKQMIRAHNQIGSFFHNDKGLKKRNGFMTVKQLAANKKNVLLCEAPVHNKCPFSYSGSGTEHVVVLDFMNDSKCTAGWCPL